MKTNYLLLITFFFILSACDADKNRILSFSTDDAAYLENEYVMEAYDENVPHRFNANQKNEVVVKQQQKLIKTAHARLKVSDLTIAREKVQQLMQQSNGVITSESRSSGRGNIEEHSMVLRVPSQVFDSVIKTLESMAVHVQNLSINVQDVTEEFVDIQARLKTKKDVEERYREILKKANTIEEILKVENALRQVREEIESAEGRLNYLSNRVSQSTINLQYFVEKPFAVAQGEGFFAKAWKAVANGWKGLLVFVIGLINIWPFLLIIAAIAFVVRRQYRKRGVKIQG